MVNVSLVIVNYNVREYLLDCLKSVYDHLSLSCEVIVVDNASTDGSVDAIKSVYPQVILIENKENRGFPAANNQAFEIANGQYIFMLNPDAVLYDDTLDILWKFMEEHPDVAIIAPRLLNTDGSFQQSVWRFPTVGSILAEMLYLRPMLKRKNYADQDLTKTFEAESFSGAAIFFRKSVLDKIGMLDESLFWIEDVDFCYRSAMAGLKCVYLPQATAVHHISKSAKKNYTISLSNQVFNKIKFFDKHKSRAAFRMVVLISLIHVLAKLLVLTLLSPFKKTWRLKAQAYAYTLPRLFNPPKKFN